MGYVLVKLQTSSRRRTAQNRENMLVLEEVDACTYNKLQLFILGSVCHLYFQCFTFLYSVMVQKYPSKEKQIESQSLVEDNSSSDESIPENLQVTEEEKRGSIQESTTATAVILQCSKTTTNPIVDRGPHKRKDRKKNKEPKSVETQVDNIS